MLRGFSLTKSEALQKAVYPADGQVEDQQSHEIDHVSKATYRVRQHIGQGNIPRSVEPSVYPCGECVGEKLGYRANRTHSHAWR